MWSVIATWPFSLIATERAAEILSAGGGALEAAEQGIRLVESDLTVMTVGPGGYLNRDGALELDAAVMDGDTLRSGAVCALRGYEHPVSIARAVLERTPHAMLAGEGAAQFARESGFELGRPEVLVTEAAREAWEKKFGKSHDTIGLVALDGTGRIIAATSTSGTAYKLPGRVGDSPLIGSGFYAESGVGGCVATGTGEDIMKTCLCFRVVDMMRAGIAPQDAATAAMRSAHERLRRRGTPARDMALVCMNARGETGAASNHSDFSCTFAADGLAPAMRHIDSAIEG